jgi:hypothetical protein
MDLNVLVDVAAPVSEEVKRLLLKANTFQEQESSSSCIRTANLSRFSKKT